MNNYLENINWNTNGLIPAIAQDYKTQRILMLAWMNKEALSETIKQNYAVYWSRSRKSLWKKGEKSGHLQKIHEIQLDCDSDTLLLKVEQIGNIACHTGTNSCFYRTLKNNEWEISEFAIKSSTEIYKDK